MLMKYVTDVDPAVVDSFERTAPADVCEAIRATVGSLLGSLPSTYFEVHVVTLGDNMRSLMYSFIMTGYLYRHVVDKLELQGRLSSSLPSSYLQDSLPQDVRAGKARGVRSESLDGFAPGANKDSVGGTVQRWNYHTGLQELPAHEYMELLEKEVALLRDRAAQQEGDEEHNDILRYVRDHQHGEVQSIRAGPAASEAMDAFLLRLLGTENAAELAKDVTETTLGEMNRVLSWLMIVGYTLRGMEIRSSMEASFTLPVVALDDAGAGSGARDSGEGA